MRVLPVVALFVLSTPGCSLFGGGGDEGGKKNGGDQGDATDPTDGDETPTDPTDADADADGDGLSDVDEASFGTDVDNPDSDGDGLTDGDEVVGGSDPIKADTDGDTYTDGAEVTEGHDPNDPEDRIYEGYWPYNPTKDDMDDPGWRGHASEGDQLPRFAWSDQFGDTVDVYDFAYHGKPVVLDLSGVWCYYCNEVAAFLDGQASIWDDYRQYRHIPDMVNDGEIYWITALDSDSGGNAISTRDLKNWYEAYPNEYIPVLGDEEYQLQDWLSVVGYPTILLMDEGMVITVYDAQNYGAVFDALIAM